ncbi:hypothetical protein HYFRA_00002175 [Hymenoscyphus fraxineus]|uniref:SPRY domain-containing protein n=1 Tax=Hymenoscyphus fraxineus TaxID=746836 RepID=A0A9N9KLA8_9HELO|nr:hypothetical protein HYFRA_00002175 [Hymenoscyphus fraxineus]
MCFGSKLKGDDPSSRLDNDYNSRPVDSKPTQPTSSKMPQNNYAPPPGPPPSHQQSQNVYNPPPGPPPNQQYTPPSGPPPSQQPQYDYSYVKPPEGPPPKQEPYHDWETAVPDTSLLPPPPSMGNQRSATNNATEAEAEQGEAWCAQNRFTPPMTLPIELLQALDRGDVGVVIPRGYKGTLIRTRPGVWAGSTKSGSPDTTISSANPVYSVIAHSPFNTGRPRTIYYEVRIGRRNRPEVSLALGYAAPPYPTFRLPGWHRGCLAVHGDDGSKFINDRWGGKNFTTPFKPGETIGLGMTFTGIDPNAPPSYGPVQTTASAPMNVEVFLTRDGRRVDGWNLHEEGDAQEDLPVTGLEGLNDLYAAVGTFESVEFEIIFNPGEWMYRPT